MSEHTGYFCIPRSSLLSKFPHNSPRAAVMTAREPELHTLKQEGKTITYTIITNQDTGHSQRRELTGDFLSSLCFKLLGVVIRVL